MEIPTKYPQGIHTDVQILLDMYVRRVAPNLESEKVSGNSNATLKPGVLSHVYFRLKDSRLYFCFWGLSREKEFTGSRTGRQFPSRPIALSVENGPVPFSYICRQENGPVPCCPHGKIPCIFCKDSCRIGGNFSPIEQKFLSNLMRLEYIYACMWEHDFQTGVPSSVHS